MSTITIQSGETLSGGFYSAGEDIVIAAGGTISDSAVRYGASSLTFEAGATVTGTLTVAVNTSVQGAVTASAADIALDISRRKEEAGLVWSDWGATGGKSLSVIVSPDQNKGTYRLVGNAAEYSGNIAITLSNSVSAGTVSLESPVLEYDITRYTLEANEAGELTLTVSSAITDDNKYIFLYKENRLVTAQQEL